MTISRAGLAPSGEDADLRGVEEASRQPGQGGLEGRTDRPGNSRAQWAQLGRLLADRLEGQGLRSAGIVRQLARLAEEGHDPEPGCCPVCGSEVVQAATGRPRLYCSPRCRKTNHRRTQPRRKRTVEE